MRSRLSKTVRTEFQRGLKAIAPRFRLDQTQKPLPGDDLYVWEVRPTVSLYICLQPHRMFDCFHVEAAASLSRKWPAFMVAAPHDKPVRGDLRFRISRLWAPNSNAEAWWLSKNMLELPLQYLTIDHEEEAQVLDERAPSVVADCIQRIETDLLPFFEELLRTGLGSNLSC